MNQASESTPRFDRDAATAGLHDFLKLVLAQARLDLPVRLEGVAGVVDGGGSVC